MFKKILIANRSEIAIRIIRACKELGISTVAIHSTADEDSLHVRFADQSVCVGPPDSNKSYLNIPAIISAAEITDVDAIHPGYGFLAENAGFAEVCASSNITFIGPTAKNIREMGHKANSRNLASGAGVSVIPGSDSMVESTEDATEIANRIGYPIIIKAAAGGGGRGMRICRDQSELIPHFDITRSEAASAFGDPSIYIERFIENPKHIEIQIMADNYGNIIHLGERDCSIQRRHQKLLEESPAPTLDPTVREDMISAALKLAKQIGYSSLGTVEFLYDGDGEFFFIEMNTRIQVEHTVTECVTSLDLVKEQIRIAAGEKTRYSQSDIRFSGHSIECRVNAEDPFTFLPNPGKVTGLNIPGGPGIRVDTALYSDAEVLPHYESLVAKLIVHGIDRKEAIAKMNRSLSEFHIAGVKTTIPLHSEILRSDAFLSGFYHTGSLDSLISEM
ncbi:MAG TPA: acetyl-CoA carboxylase biotin carboxylase subunit [Nitrospinota bacterium]|nr:acetyl-CoA carboxylase biotin carboxylase subunit [Nitrospinota bacterium]|tara:strand:+ start:123678 stop:125021 length:1344 start_codon:yes stop_codon:yes gene_type:complete